MIYINKFGRFMRYSDEDTKQIPRSSWHIHKNVWVIGWAIFTSIISSANSNTQSSRWGGNILSYLSSVRDTQHKGTYNSKNLAMAMFYIIHLWKIRDIEGGNTHYMAWNILFNPIHQILVILLDDMLYFLRNVWMCTFRTDFFRLSMYLTWIEVSFFASWCCCNEEMSLTLKLYT